MPSLNQEKQRVCLSNSSRGVGNYSKPIFLVKLIMIDKTITNPGFHRQFDLSKFNEDEKCILRKLAKDWYMTNPGDEIYIAQSKYKYFLMKPSRRTSEMFNIEREIVCVLSNYENFEPRSLDFFDEVYKRLPKLRAETMCGVLFSRALNVEEKVERLLKADPENQIIIPASYDELVHGDAVNILENRFRKHFYSRDLFSFLSPLKRDIYFFGRNPLITEIVNRYRSGEHTSLFGLRKSGKTSIVYALERKLSANNDQVVSIDCESPSIHLLRWNELLEKLVKLYHKEKGSKLKIATEGRYGEKSAASSFEEDILKIYQSKKRHGTLFIFDEIERITPKTASSPHWSEEGDFVYFWQTLRGFYQKHPEVFCYMLVGTNPGCIETPDINGHDNPIYASMPSQYVPLFDVDQVSEMVCKLGSYMGLRFDKMIAGKLKEDFGGHPFLIRQVCSHIHKLASSSRPTDVDLTLYRKARGNFSLDSHGYLDMMLKVLVDWYPDEYEMIKFLANNDFEGFGDLAESDPALVRHLIGYGVVKKGASHYYFNIENLSDLLRKKHKKHSLSMTPQEKVQEISMRRNSFEKNLRGIIRSTLIITKGKPKAYEAVISAMPSDRRDGLSGYDLDHLLSKDSSPLFFNDLINILKRNWPVFENTFGMRKQKIEIMLEEINKVGRPDAHAKDIDEIDFNQLRIYFDKLEAVIDEVSL